MVDKLLAENCEVVAEYDDEEEDTYEPQTIVIDGKSYKPGMFLPGELWRGNRKGRPKGKTLKEWSKDFLAQMSDEERLIFMQGLPKEVIWRMAEGNPTEDRNVTVSVPRPILGGTTQEEQTVNTNSEEIGPSMGVGDEG